MALPLGYPLRNLTHRRTRTAITVGVVALVVVATTLLLGLVSSLRRTLVSTGVTWRQLAETFRQIRWDKELVRELGLNPDDLPPRDRARYWYAAITTAQVGSPKARDLGDAYARIVAPLGYFVGPAPGS